MVPVQSRVGDGDGLTRPVEGEAGVVANVNHTGQTGGHSIVDFHGIGRLNPEETAVTRKVLDEGEPCRGLHGCEGNDALTDATCGFVGPCVKQFKHQFREEIWAEIIRHHQRIAIEGSVSEACIHAPRNVVSPHPADRWVLGEHRCGAWSKPNHHGRAIHVVQDGRLDGLKGGKLHVSVAVEKLHHGQTI